MPTRWLVTGANGFIGCGMLHRLLADPRNFVVNIDCLYDCATRTLCDSIPGRYKFVRADITKDGVVLKELLLYNIEVVVHFAAQSHVDTSFSNPHIYIKDNVLGTQCVLEALRECHEHSPVTKPRLIHISTDEVYGQSSCNEDGDDAKHEDSLLKPSSVYAATKCCAEMLVHAAQCSHKLPAVIVRGNNCIGCSRFGPNGQYQEKLVPRFITLLQQDLPLTVQGDGTQRRSFVHVDDFVSGILCVEQKGQNGQIYNIGSDYEVSVLDVAREIARAMGKERTAKIMFVRDRNFNDKRYWIKSDALRNLGWQQTISFVDTIKEAVDWYVNKMPVNYFMVPYVLPVPIQVAPLVPLFPELVNEFLVETETSAKGQHFSVVPETDPEDGDDDAIVQLSQLHVEEQAPEA